MMDNNCSFEDAMLIGTMPTTPDLCRCIKHTHTAVHNKNVCNP